MDCQPRCNQPNLVLCNKCTSSVMHFFAPGDSILVTLLHKSEVAEHLCHFDLKSLSSQQVCDRFWMSFFCPKIYEAFALDVSS